MKIVNAERIKNNIEACIERECENCSYDEQTSCKETMLCDALALIISQEQKIKELGEENKQFRYEQRKLIEERDTFREYAYNMQKYVENIRHKEEEGYEPSAARITAEMEMWRVVALEKKKLTEENERLLTRNFDLAEKGEKVVIAYKKLSEEHEKILNHYFIDTTIGSGTSRQKCIEETVKKYCENLHIEFASLGTKDKFNKEFFLTRADQIAEKIITEELKK